MVSSNDYEKYIESAPTNVTFVGNKQGIKYFLKSKYAFYCFGKYPIKPSKNQTVVNLWHGTPLKKIGNLEKGLEKIDYNFLPLWLQVHHCINRLWQRFSAAMRNRYKYLEIQEMMSYLYQTKRR